MRAPVPFVTRRLPVVVVAGDPRRRRRSPPSRRPTWDALAPGQPFLSHAFLSALHETGCATPRDRLDAALPHRVARATRSLGALPLYAKTHSYGEYVFDWGWADAYRRHGRRYYPKLVAAVPFTPVPGPRLLARRRRARAARCSTHALALVRAGRFSSLHVLFPDEAQAARGRSARA